MPKGGSKGRYRGGGGVNPNNIKDPVEMISARNDSNREQIDDVLQVSREVVDEFGSDAATGGFTLATFTGKDANTLGCYMVGGGITMNAKYATNKNMDAAMDKCAEEGFHPSRGNKSGIYAVAAHEYGHSLTENARKAMGETSFDRAATRIVTEARKTTGDRGNIIFGRKISEYATKNDAETIAEAFADFKCNGNKAKKQSKAIVNVLNKYIKTGQKSQSQTKKALVANNK